MKRFTKYAVGLALAASAATMLAAAPASAQPYGYYAPRAAVCDPYSRYYDPYYCHAGYYGPAWGGPVIDFSFGGRGFGGGWGGHDFHGGGFHGGGFGGHPGGGAPGGHHH